MRKIKDYDIQAVWQENDVSKKKALINEMINNFQHKKKQQHFFDQVEKTNSAARLDFIATNLMHTGDGNAIVK